METLSHYYTNKPKIYVVKCPSMFKERSDKILKMMKLGYTPLISRTHCTSPDNLFLSHAPNIKISRPMPTSPHKEEYIWPILRMNAYFTGTNYSTSYHSYRNLIITPTASY